MVSESTSSTPRSSQSLEEYLRDQYLVDKREIREIESLMADVLPVFLTAWDKTNEEWFYRIKNGERIETADESHSTCAMITFVLSAFQSPRPLSYMLPRVKPISADQAKKGAKGSLSEKFDDEWRAVLAQAGTKCRNRIESDAGTRSGTYGIDDPFTLGWLIEICQLHWGENLTEENNEILGRRIEEINKRFRISKGKFEPPFKFKKRGKDESDVLPHAFTYLKCLQLGLALNRMRGWNGWNELLERYREFFGRTIHHQLSYHQIPDSRFDPAELVFALEGALLAGEESHRTTTFSEPVIPEEGLISRIFSVLEDCQNHNPYWRPLKPIISTRRGKVLFPVSVETANSLLRIFALLDRGRFHDTYFSRHLGLLRRYTKWIRARRTDGRFHSPDIENIKFSGWQSEHTGDTDAIHLWETSQVVLYLLYYTSMLRHYVARQTVIAGGFEAEQCLLKDDAEWNTIKKIEPISEGNRNNEKGAIFAAYDLMEKHYVEPRSAASEPHAGSYSMLLYGPPGTGKTYVSRAIAQALGYQFITITTSDFFSEGHVFLEARAKAIFDALEEQTDTVVLFDEMDQFLLDRNSERYEKQDTAFKFLTPGMLTKINDLRSKNGPIFIIATNYEERIDGAIKRAGRIDHRILLLPPDLKARESILRALFGKFLGKKGALGLFDEKSLKRTAKQTALMTWKELHGLKKEVEREIRERNIKLKTETSTRKGSGRSRSKTAQDIRKHNEESRDEAWKVLEDQIEKNKPSISLRTYVDRLDSDYDVPALEFLAVSFLDDEPNKKFGPFKKKSLSQVVMDFKRGTPDARKDWEKLFRRVFPKGAAKRRRRAKQAWVKVRSI